jgi:hypothetical protein
MDRDVFCASRLLASVPQNNGDSPFSPSTGSLRTPLSAICVRRAGENNHVAAAHGVNAGYGNNGVA